MRTLLACLGLLGAAHADTYNIGITTAIPNLRPVPGNFVGFSVEVPQVLGYMGDNGTVKSYAQVLRNFRDKSGASADEPMVLRWGGNSADESCWGGCPNGEGEYTLSDKDIAAYKTFASETANDVNVKFVIDVNFGMTPNPSTYAVPHVQAVGRHGLWPYVYAVEIGNEVDLYPRHPEKGHRNASYTFSEYEVEFGQYVAALTQAGMPPKMVRGATFADSKDPWVMSGLADYLTKYNDVFQSMSYHNYPITYCNNDANQTILGNAQSAQVWTNVEDHVTYVTQANQLFDLGIPFWNGEGNSASCGGVPGVSNTFMATLWVMDYLSHFAKTGTYGPVGMNFHGGPQSGPGYSPVVVPEAGSIEIRPVYYGMLAFTEFTAHHAEWMNFTVAPSVDITCKGGIVANAACCPKSCGVCGGPNCSTAPGGADNCCDGLIIQAKKACGLNAPPCVMSKDDDYAIDVHVVRDTTAKEYRVLLINKFDQVLVPHTAHICGVGSGGSASLIRITAPSKSATTGISYAGQTFDGTTDGVIKGTRVTTPVPSSGGCYDVTVPSMSIAILSIPQ